MKHLPGSPLFGRLLALPTNIRISWKSLPRIKTLAFYEHSYITFVKGFLTLGPERTSK
jgi:hypothetical protein